MPNGGSDCCGTCWFNAKNKGKARYAHSDDPEPDYCRIRGLEIHEAFYTYCANHPHRNPSRHEVPIGPVFVGEERELWRRSPDTEDIRGCLLELLSQVSADPSPQYPIGIYSEQVVIWQLGEFREERALSDLQRIAGFEPGPVSSDPYGRTRDTLIASARLAIEKVEGSQPIEFREDRMIERLEELRRRSEDLQHTSQELDTSNSVPAERPAGFGRTDRWLILGAVAFSVLVILLSLMLD